MIIKNKEDREAAEAKRQELTNLLGHAQQQTAIWSSRAEQTRGALALIDEQLQEPEPEEPSE